MRRLHWCLWWSWGKSSKMRKKRWKEGLITNQVALGPQNCREYLSPKHTWFQLAENLFENASLVMALKLETASLCLLFLFLYRFCIELWTIQRYKKAGKHTCQDCFTNHVSDHSEQFSCFNLCTSFCASAQWRVFFFVAYFSLKCREILKTSKLWHNIKCIMQWGKM